MEANMQSKGEFRSYEGCIAVGPWGDTTGDVWTYKPPSPIKEVTIVHGSLVNSLTFKSHNARGSEEYRLMFHDCCPYSTITDKIGLDNPLEYLTNISGTFEDLCGLGVVIRSLCFYTNLTKYGPYGSNDFGTAFSSAVESGVVVGFFGRLSGYSNAFGIYVAPKSSIHSSVPNQENFTAKEISGVKLMKGEAMPREVGPWGGGGGKPWDDGVFAFIKEIHLHIGHVPSKDLYPSRAVSGIQFTYVNRDGISVLSPIHGSQMEAEPRTIIKMDGEKEYLVGVAGFYAPIASGMEAITSITFYTNKQRYGPYGWIFGTYFSSISSAGKVVGFHGRGGAYLNAIGVHTEYISTSATICETQSRFIFPSVLHE